MSIYREKGWTRRDFVGRAVARAAHAAPRGDLAAFTNRSAVVSCEVTRAAAGAEDLWGPKELLAYVAHVLAHAITGVYLNDEGKNPPSYVAPVTAHTVADEYF